MSHAYDEAVVRLNLADYAAGTIDSKLNMIGGGLLVLNRHPQEGVTAPFSVVVEMLLPDKILPCHVAWELRLVDEAGATVELSSVPPQKMQIAQSIEVLKPVFDSNLFGHIERGALPQREQLVFNFQNGLPLPASAKMAWVFAIDGETRPEWQYDFHTSGAPTRPVFG